MSQNTDLMQLLKERQVTPLVALQRLGIYNFSARLTEIGRKLVGTGKRLHGEWVTLPNKKRFKAYRIVRIDAKA